MRISYVNGSYVPHDKATIHIDDRGTDFSDGVYEVIAFVNRRMVDGAPHLARLERSLAAVEIVAPMPTRELNAEIEKLISQNAIDNGLLYIRITRGCCERNHPYPAADVKPTLVMTVKPWAKPSEKEYTNGVKSITYPEKRWADRFIKSISLLPNVMAKQKAVKAGAKEAWFVEKDGTVTEASSSNVYIVKNSTIITHPANENILGGITRETLLRLAASEGIKVEERKFTLDEALKADEAIISSTSMGALAVVELDGKQIGTGKPGAVSSKLYELYEKYINETAQA